MSMLLVSERRLCLDSTQIPRLYGNSRHGIEQHMYVSNGFNNLDTISLPICKLGIPLRDLHFHWTW